MLVYIYRKFTKYYNSKTINGACKTVSTFIPSEKRLGSTKQLMDMTRESDGIHLTKSHAYKIVQTKSQNSVSVHLGQYLFLKSYFEFLCELFYTHVIWLSGYHHFLSSYPLTVWSNLGVFPTE